MKKFKILTVVLLLAIIVSLFMTTLVACDPKEDVNPDSGDISGGTPPGSGVGSGDDPIESGDPKDPEDPWDWPDPKPPSGGDDDKPKPPSLKAIDFLDKIAEAIETPDDVLNINISATVETKDADYIVAVKGNLYEVLPNLDADGNPIESTKGKNELAFTIHSQGKTQKSQQKLMFAIYIIGNKLYVDRADGTPLLYLSDFDINYMIQIIKGAGGMVGDLIEGIDPKYLNLVTGAVTTFLLAKPEVVLNDDKSMDVSMEVTINTVLDGANGILGTLLGSFGVSLPIEISPIINYLKTLIPSDESFYLKAGFKADGELDYLGFDGVRKGNEGGFSINASIELTDKASADIGIPDAADIESIDFSFTNMQFAIDLKLASQKDEFGELITLDVGKLINGFLPTANIPEGLLLIKGGTGLRLSFKLDLDLDYDGIGVDNNKIAIELYLLDPFTNRPVDVSPQLGLYYTDGSFYLNTDNMLPEYLNGLNIKLDASMSELLDILVNLITDAIDKTFGISFDEIRNQGAELTKDGTIKVTSASMLENVLQKSTASVVALASEGDGEYKLAPALSNLVSAIAAVLGLGGSKDSQGNVLVPPNIYADDTSIKVVVNNNFFRTLGGLIPALGNIQLPSAIGDVVLSVNTYEGGIKDITIGTSINNVFETKEGEDSITVIDPALNVELSLGNFLIGFAEEGLVDYINSKVDKQNTNYLTSLNGVIEHMLGGIRFSSGFKMQFEAGTYDLAPFIAGFGVKEVENSHILWEFTDNFTIDASLNLQIALNRTDTAKSMIVLEMKTTSGIKVGEGDDYIIAPDQVLLGIYGYNNNIYIDISNLNIAGIVLPKLNFSLNFTDLIYTLLDDVVAKLLKQINVNDGDLKFAINFKDLFGIGKSDVAGKEESGAGALALANEGSQPSTPSDISSALVLVFNTERIQPVLSLATILAILNATGTDLGNTLSEALSLMELELSVDMTRNKGFTFTFEGDFIPKLDENGETVYYYDGSGKKIEVEKDKNYVFRHISERPEGVSEIIVGNTVYYTKKEYHYGSEMKLEFQAGTKDFPVIVGNLGVHKYPIESKVEDFKNFKSDLVQAIFDTIGKASIALDIDLRTLDNEMNVTKLINSILANVGKKMDLPISLDLDDWNSHVQLLLSWNLDMAKFSNSKILLELKYEQKNIIGLYIFKNRIMVDLEGLGLFSGQITNSTIVTKIFTMVDTLIKQIDDLDLNNIIDKLLKDAGLPTVGTKPEGSDQVSRASDGVATDSNVPTIGEGLKVTDFISYITQAIRLEDTAIVIDFTSSIINGMLNELVGINLGMNLGVNGKLDLFGDSLDLGIKVEDIEMDAKLSLSLGKDVEIPINFDTAPEWDATNGREFTTTLLNKLNIGFTIDLANYTNDTVNLGQNGGSTDNYRVYTRITIEKITAPAGKRLTNVSKTIYAPQGSFLVTLAHIDKSRYDNTQLGSSQPLVYVILDHRKASGQLTLVLCNGLVSIAAVDIGSKIDPINIDLDLVGMLAPVIDDLFKTIDGALDGLGSSLTGGASGASDDADTPMTLANEGGNEPTGIEKVFADLDVIKLLGEKGIMLKLKANGMFNVTIEFDPYIINKLIDDIMSWVFAKGTGHGSLVNLAEMASNMFSQDYLSMITWTRERYGADNILNTLWGDLRNILPDLVKDLVKNVIGGAGGVIVGGIIPPATVRDVANQLRPIISGLLPFAVWNTATLEVNVIDATIANIHFRGQDNWEHIYIDNDEKKGIAYDKDESGRGGNKTSDGELFFTEIFIYNTSQSVGEHPADGSDKKGLVTWADLPTDLTFMPYIYKDVDAGVADMLDQYFTNKTAIYQRGTKIMRSPITFKIMDGSAQLNMNSTNLKHWFTTYEECKVLAIAQFKDGDEIIERTHTITIDIRDDGEGLLGVEDIEMHAYDDELPDFITVYTQDHKSRKINTRYLTINNWRPKTYEAHDVETEVIFANGTSLPLTIHYLDSTVTTMIIGGVEGKNVNVDLYSFDLTKSKIEDFTPETLYFKYADGKAVGLDVLRPWTTTGQDGLFNRELNVDGKYSSNVNGYEFSIKTTIAAYDAKEDKYYAEQEVELVFTARTKKVDRLTINGAVNTISVDPYEYYRYVIKESNVNPFPDVAIADYYDIYRSYDGSKNIIDSYSEEVKIEWRNIDGIDFTWNKEGADVNKEAKIALKNSEYPGGTFTWEFPTQVSVLRNEVEAIYFDEELTQATYYIDPFQYVVNGKGTENFVKYAWVKFTNGSVYKMPIAWDIPENFEVDPMKPSQFRQFDVYIGFDIEEYKKGNIQSCTGIKGNLLQDTFVNVQIESRRPKGLLIDGSELVGGTYYIDPVQVLYYGMSPFPSTVKVEYMSGKTSILEITNEASWIRQNDFPITLKGKKGLKVTLELNEEYSFDIDVEIIDRSNLESQLKNLSIDPYIYKIDDDGNRVYDSYVDAMTLYQTVGSFDVNTFEISGVKVSSMGEFAPDTTYFRYKLTYQNTEGNTEERLFDDLDFVKDFVRSNEELVLLYGEVIEYFEVPIAWDLNEVNYSIADTYTVKAIAQAKDESLLEKDRTFKVAVEILAKKVDKIEGVEYITVGGTNLSESVKQSRQWIINKSVVFDDGTVGRYECTVDLTGINFELAISATLRRTTYLNGKVETIDLRNQGKVLTTEEEIEACAMPVKVTVCSGDIAQVTTIKLHIVEYVYESVE